MTRPTAISLFSGLGGMDIGLHQAGIETRVCVEFEDEPTRTLQANSAHHELTPTNAELLNGSYPWRLIGKDIYDVTTEEILEVGDLSVGEADLLVGGPPCQTFSRSNEGSRAGTNADRGMLYEEFARVLREAEPQAFIFENVRGLASANDGKDLEIILDELASTGYKVRYDVLNAADFGVPQTRERLFIIGLRNGDTPHFPEPTHVETKNPITDKGTWVSASEALTSFDLDEGIEDVGGYVNAVGGKYGHLLRDVPPGANYQHFSERKYDPESGEYVQRGEDELDDKVFDWRSRHWNYLLKQDPSRPTWTIQADPGTYVGPFHWRSRPYSLLEQMRLMDIPVDFYVDGSPREVQRQIGNAVPPGLASAIARSLLSQLGIEPSEPEPATPPETDGGLDPEEAIDGTIWVTNGMSPWAYANGAIPALSGGDEVELVAQGSKVPNAIDVAEILRRQTAFVGEYELHHDVVEVPESKSEELSEIRIEISP